MGTTISVEFYRKVNQQSYLMYIMKYYNVFKDVLVNLPCAEYDKEGLPDFRNKLQQSFFHLITTGKTNPTSLAKLHNKFIDTLTNPLYNEQLQFLQNSQLNRM